MPAAGPRARRRAAQGAIAPRSAIDGAPRAAPGQRFGSGRRHTRAVAAGPPAAGAISRPDPAGRPAGALFFGGFGGFWSHAVDISLLNRFIMTYKVSCVKDLFLICSDFDEDDPALETSRMRGTAGPDLTLASPGIGCAGAVVSIRAMRKPEYVTLPVVFMASESAPAGVIVTAGAGIFSAAQIVESNGINLGHGADTVADYWTKISDFALERLRRHDTEPPEVSLASGGSATAR
jgi:hypothetical protein